MSDSFSQSSNRKRIRLPQAQFSQSQPSQSLPKARALPKTGGAQSFNQLQPTFSANNSFVSRSSEVAMQSINPDQGLPEETTSSRDFLKGSFTGNNSSGDEAYLDQRLEKAFSEDEKRELLSAYMDDELSIHEQRLVRQWLDSDAQLNQYYQHQLRLRQAIQSLPADSFALEVSPASEGKLAARPLAASDLGEATHSEISPLEKPCSDEQDADNFFATDHRKNIYFPYDLRQRHLRISVTAAHARAQPKVLGNNGGFLSAIAPDDSLRRGLVVVAALGATTVTLLASGLTDRLRPGNLNRLKGLSNQAVQGQAL